MKVRITNLAIGILCLHLCYGDAQFLSVQNVYRLAGAREPRRVQVTIHSDLDNADVILGWGTVVVGFDTNLEKRRGSKVECNILEDPRNCYRNDLSGRTNELVVGAQHTW